MRASLSNPSDLASEMNCFMNRLNSGGKGAKKSHSERERRSATEGERQTMINTGRSI